MVARAERNLPRITTTACMKCSTDTGGWRSPPTEELCPSHGNVIEAASGKVRKNQEQEPDKDLQLAFMEAGAEAGSYAAHRDKQKRGGKEKEGKGQRKTERLSQKWNCWICETDEHDVRKCRLCEKMDVGLIPAQRTTKKTGRIQRRRTESRRGKE
ncbi:hypothetical protein Q8A67_019455 [Cirrhinus molitorella]|uniref:Uncharacterized protein n=1 Tax=Cirrhinus molitorella TaxID=172907 RepID=A0AA88TDN1_9TELE|nr:hypothetical protein Q8A67_019455 [Cirrhinus molitorella]